MKLGVSSFAFGWAVGVPGHHPPCPFTAFDLIAVARAHDLRSVQFGDHLSLHNLSAAEVEQLRVCAEQGPTIELETGARGLTEAHLANYITLCGKLRSPLLRFVIDQTRYEPAPQQVVSIVRAALPLLESAQLTLGIENHDRFPARVLRQMIEQIDSPRVGICLDTVNSLGAGEGLEHVLDQLAPHTVNLHVKDFEVTRVPYAMGFTVEGRPAGQGRLDLPTLLATLARHRRCRSATLETWVPPEPTLAETIAKEQRWVEKSLTYLKPLFPSR